MTIATSPTIWKTFFFFSFSVHAYIYLRVSHFVLDMAISSINLRGLSKMDNSF